MSSIVITTSYSDADLMDALTNWQVVFKLGGKDYCRETQPGRLTQDAIRAWAERQCQNHSLDGAEIQRW